MGTASRDRGVRYVLKAKADPKKKRAPSKRLPRGVMTSRPSELAEILYDIGTLRRMFGKIHVPSAKLEDRPASCLLRCRKCRFSETVVAPDQEFAVQANSIAFSSWMSSDTQHFDLSADTSGLILGLASRTVREQWDAFRHFIQS